jgi:hypothetical protein
MLLRQHPELAELIPKAERRGPQPQQMSRRVSDRGVEFARSRALASRRQRSRMTGSTRQGRVEPGPGPLIEGSTAGPGRHSEYWGRSPQRAISA